MSAIPGDNPACCTNPTAESNYQPKGKFETISGLEAYVVGDKTTKKAIVMVPDIFGTSPQLQQGCDILASQGFYVVLPDILGDQVLLSSDVPFDSPEKIAKRKRLFEGNGKPENAVPICLKYGQDLKDEGFKVGGVGFCWGAKVLFQAGATDVYTAVAGAHPSLLTPEEAENLKAKLGLYPSSQEDPAKMEPFMKIAADYKSYSEAPHGFAAARANFDDPVSKATYEDAYGRFIKFFTTHL